MPEILRLYVRLIGARMRGQMQYRASFLMMTAGHFPSPPGFKTQALQAPSRV